MKQLVLSVLAALAMAGPATAATEGLKQFVWKNRVLLIFAPMDTADRDRQRHVIRAEQAGFAERDMVVIEISDTRADTLFGTATKLDASALRARFDIDVSTSFAAVLIGKDGGVKLRKEDPVTSAELFALIDSMPMRASEIRK